ncbi:hypothetical protein KJ966_03095 [bacterium]|nr:hypothetical protein [bacterium]
MLDFRTITLVPYQKIVKPDLETDSPVKEITAETGLKVTHHRLGFFDICPDCKKAGKGIKICSLRDNNILWIMILIQNRQ